MHGRRVLDSIDDALVIRQRHPVLFARASSQGLTTAELANLFDAWFVGHWALPSWANAFNASPATRRRAAKRRRQRKAAR